jgi:hypothetical protein
MNEAVQGIIYNRFSWKDFGINVLASVGLTLITFGAGYAAGGLVGLAL